jgi:hypothetical protein
MRVAHTERARTLRAGSSPLTETGGRWQARAAAKGLGALVSYAWMRAAGDLQSLAYRGCRGLRGWGLNELVAVMHARVDFAGLLIAGRTVCIRH